MASTAPMTPNFEVKVLLNPDNAIERRGLTPQPVENLLKTFNIPTGESKIAMAVQYLDTGKTKTIYTAGWSPRIRRMADDAKRIELTYKKRYTIPLPDTLTTFNADPNTDVSIYQTAINQVLVLAAADGFDASETDYDAQIEWGYQKLTLSITRKKKEKAAEWDLGGDSSTLPDEETSRKMLIKQAPGKFKNWKGVHGWGAETLKEARVYGPVNAFRWEGKWDGGEVDIEIWPVKGAGEGGVDLIGEVSFKTDDASVAKERQGRLIEVLRGGGWFLEGDSLKTQIIMDRY